jgi:hypothetical protein
MGAELGSKGICHLGRVDTANSPARLGDSANKVTGSFQILNSPLGMAATYYQKGSIEGITAALAGPSTRLVQVPSWSRTLETISLRAIRGHLALSVSLSQRRLQCGIPSTSDDNAFFAVFFSREISGKNLDHLFTSISFQSCTVLEWLKTLPSRHAR